MKGIAIHCMAINLEAILEQDADKKSNKLFNFIVPLSI